MSKSVGKSQDTVEGVEYDPSEVGIYNLTRENLAEVTGQFLEDENALLSDGRPCGIEHSFRVVYFRLLLLQ